MQQKSQAGAVSTAGALATRLLGGLAGGLRARLVPRAPDTTLDTGGPPAPGPRGLGLSAKLLILTVLFVMLAEVLIFLPSVANFRINWLTDRLTAARLASLAADARTDGNIPPTVRLELLSTAKVQYVAIKHGGMRRLVLPPDGPIDIERSYDLRRDPNLSLLRRFGERFGLINDALMVITANGSGTIRVYGHPTQPMDVATWGMDDFVEIVLPEAPLRNAMVAFALNILALSIIISMIAAALLYLALNRLLVQPILRLADNMEGFSRAPENASLIITPSNRTDEVGTAERELQHMQKELRSMLNQKNHLAALGLAVSKISHDLRNMLATAQLLSDRLTTIKDPAVQRFSPTLIASLDRAIALCTDTLQYGRAQEAEPRRVLFPLAGLVAEVGEGLGLPRASIGYVTEMDAALEIDADRDQVYRILNNIVRNAVQAIEQQSDAPVHNEIRISARRESTIVVCEVRDDGPGIPPKARANLFRAFQGGARKGGTGLGLAIAAELAAAHGGSLEFVGTEQGAAFRLVLPDRATQA